MSRVEKSALVPYSAANMFALVDDVERYPAFLPWCGGAEVLERDAVKTVATIHIHYLGIRQSFTTENTKVDNLEMKIKLLDGPFEHLDGVWRFQALETSACKIIFILDYGFANTLLEAAIGPVFGVIANTMIDRFVARADTLYGTGQ